MIQWKIQIWRQIQIAEVAKWVCFYVNGWRILRKIQIWRQIQIWRKRQIQIAEVAKCGVLYMDGEAEMPCPATLPEYKAHKWSRWEYKDKYKYEEGIQIWIRNTNIKTKYKYEDKYTYQIKTQSTQMIEMRIQRQIPMWRHIQIPDQNTKQPTDHNKNTKTNINTNTKNTNTNTWSE